MDEILRDSMRFLLECAAQSATDPRLHKQATDLLARLQRDIEDEEINRAEVALFESETNGPKPKLIL